MVLPETSATNCSLDKMDFEASVHFPDHKSVVLLKVPWSNLKSLWIDFKGFVNTRKVKAIGSLEI